VSVANRLLKHDPSNASATRLLLQASRRLALSEARAGNRTRAVAVMKRPLEVAQAERSAAAGVAPRRLMEPRTYCALYEVALAMNDTAAARHWQEQAVAAWRATSELPGFTVDHQNEMTGCLQIGAAR
jgi:hypothetical protein